MQILSSGSFINLENREKIEQLIFTAKEIAAAAVETEGFVSDGENNRRLALEIWQGAEYMCREHEEANVKNIFINNFLARLKELGGEAAAQNGFSSNSAASNGTTNAVNQSKDEFLGFVSSPPETDQNTDAEVYQTPNENTVETDVAESMNNAPEDLIFGSQSEKGATELPAPNEALIELIQASEIAQSSSEKIGEPNEVGDNNAAQIPVQNVTNEKPVIGAISLPEKEPYQFDKCTVTTIIQLLPTEADHKRRAVISVRTHDFAPQIWTHEFPSETGLEAMMPVLNDALNRYSQELPLKVIDKLKREKSTTRGRQTNVSKSASSEFKTGSGANRAATKTENKAADKNTNAVEGKSAMTTAKSDAQPIAGKNESLSQIKPSAKSAKPQEVSQQGSLFGF